MARSFFHVEVGDEVDILFRGSKSLGNEPYTLENLTVQEATRERVRFSDGVEIYRFEGKWCYGTSAETASLVGHRKAHVLNG